VNSVRRKPPERRQAFTLVEIMIIVALIGLLAALAMPGFIQVRKQSQGKRIVNDARIIDAAINDWALEVGVADGTPVDLTAAGTYTKLGTINTIDVLGNPYVIGNVGDSQIAVSADSKAALVGVDIDWGAY
jgi:type II secretory pathway pseudopilin PulG